MNRTALNTFQAALSGGLATGGAFLASVIVARLLGVADSGQVAYLVWLALFTATALDLGLASTATRFIPELRGAGQHEEARQAAGAMLRWILLAISLGTGAGGIAILWAHNWTLNGAAPLYLLVGLFAASQGLGVYAIALLRGQSEFKRAAQLTALSMGAQLIAVSVGAAAGGISGALAGYALAQLILGVAALRLASLRQRLTPDLRRRILRYAAYAWAGNLANAFVWSRLELFFLDRYWGAEAVGYFAAALALTGLATRLPVMLTLGVLPMLSEQRGRADLEGMRRACATGTRLLALVLFPACVCVAALMPTLLPLIFGEAFRPAVLPSVILAGAATVSVGATIITNYLWAMERSDVFFALAMAGAVLATAAGLTVIPGYGVTGAALARAGVQTALVVPAAWFAVSRLGCRMPILPLLRILAAALLASGAAAAMQGLIGGTASLLAALPAAALIYLLALRLLSALPAEDLDLLERLAAELPRCARCPCIALLSIITPSAMKSVQCTG